MRNFLSVTLVAVVGCFFVSAPIQAKKSESDLIGDLLDDGDDFDEEAEVEVEVEEASPPKRERKAAPPSEPAPPKPSTSSAPKATEPAARESTPTKVETINAAPVADGKASDGEQTPELQSEATVPAKAGAADLEDETDPDGLNAILNGPGVGGFNKSWQLIMATSTAFSSGNFVSRESDPNGTFGNTVDVGDANRTGAIVQNVDLRFQYNFKLFGEALRARARWLFDVEYTTPNTTSDVSLSRFNPFDLSLDITDMSIVSDPTFGIVLGGARLTLPTSRISDVRDRWTQASLFATWVKPFDFGLMLFAGVRGSYNIQDEISGICGFARDSATGGAGSEEAVDGGDCGEVSGAQAVNTGGTQIPLAEGQRNPDWEGSVSVGANYNVTERLTLTYSLAYIFTTTPSTPDDEFVAPSAQTGRDIASDFFSTALSVNYVLNDAVTAVVGELPFSLSGGATVSAFHSATDLQNNTFWPTFVTAFDNNRGAGNFAQVSLNLIASY
ncbi:MAG: hypothetical protein AAF658_02285 [Myxococcota bacterium]